MDIQLFLLKQILSKMLSFKPGLCKIIIILPVNQKPELRTVVLPTKQLTVLHPPIGHITLKPPQPDFSTVIQLVPQPTALVHIVKTLGTLLPFMPLAQAPLLI